MKLKINGNYYELHFGIKFINRLDHAMGISVDGQKFDLAGLQPAITGLSTYDPSALATIIHCAISNNKVTEDMVDDYLESGDVDLNTLFVDVYEELKDSSVVNFQLMRLTNGKKLDQIVKITMPKKKSTSTSK